MEKGGNKRRRKGWAKYAQFAFRNEKFSRIDLNCIVKMKTEGTQF